MDPRILKNIYQFMQRVHLQGDEAFAYVEAKQALERELMPRPPEKPAEAE